MARAPLGKTKRKAALPEGFEPEPVDFNLAGREAKTEGEQIADEAEASRQGAAQRIEEITGRLFHLVESDDVGEFQRLAERMVLYAFICGRPVNPVMFTMVKQVCGRQKATLAGPDTGADTDQGLADLAALASVQGRPEPSA